MLSIRHAFAFSLSLAASAVVACKGHDNAATDSAAGVSAGPATPAPATTPVDSTGRMAADSASNTALSDGNILAVVDAGDSAEVAVAKYMIANGDNAKVKAYAELLARDHNKGKTSVDATAKRLNITMQLPSNDTTAQSTSHTLDQLKSLKGADRDTAFINHEIADHQQDIADANRMVTAASQADVKSLLQKELPELQKHLDRAQALSTQLASSKKE